MLFEKIKSDILAHNSYVVGSQGEAAVIDPRRDCLIYADMAEKMNMNITHIFETHKNEDYVIGSRELERPTGAPIYHGARENFQFGNDVREGDTFSVGTLELSVLETPGHTVESISLVLRDRSVSDKPLMVFTGDALFAGDVGRTDLAGEDKREQMSSMLYDSLHEKILPLGDDIIVCPAHGAGSVCGGAISDREYTTIGYERKSMPLLQMGKEEFVDTKVNEKLSEPPYFTMMRKLNREGPPIIGNLPYLKALDADEILAYQEQKAQILDIRSPTSFAGGHIPGSIHVWRAGLPAYIGYILNYEDPIILIDDFNLDFDATIRHFVRLGYDNVTGYLAEGFPKWFKAGKEIESTGTWSVHDLHDHINDESVYILDARKPDDWEKGHISGAHHIYVGDLEQNLERIPKDKHIAVHCDVGFKGSIAASILQRNGFAKVTNVLGGTKGWQAAGFPLVEG